MKPLASLALTLAAAVAGAAAGAASRADREPSVPAFADVADLEGFLQRRSDLLDASARQHTDEAVELQMFASEAAAAPPDAGSSEDSSITNVQEVGVDEGGLVKARGDLLVVLRRGRLFTISTAYGGMRAIDRIDAFPPGADARGAWYDELLLAGDHALVIGYDYLAGATEIVRFDLSPEGRLAFRDAHQIRTADYYSSGNFASRLIGDRLVLYAPLPLEVRRRRSDRVLAEDVLPAMRRWSADRDAPWRTIAGPRDIHLSAADRASPLGAQVLHAVTVCDVGSVPLDCRARGVVGGDARTFYASADALYLWAARPGPRGSWRAATPATLVRLPLAEGAPQAIAARGMPVDQFSFRERAGALEVLVADEGTGDAMWPGGAAGSLHLLQLPLHRFGDGSGVVRDPEMRRLHDQVGESWSIRNRFVGDHLLIGADLGERNSVLLVASLDGHGVTRLDMTGRMGRIEPVGTDALVVTGHEHTTLNLVDLSEEGRIAARLSGLEGAEAESRSHGFFFRSDPGAGGRRGAMALPLIDWSRDPSADLTERVSMIFVRREGATLTGLGALGGARRRGFDDGCRASCVDWYGDARPIFLGDRMFALLGYELVEGRLDGRGVHEVARLDFSPPASRGD